VPRESLSQAANAKHLTNASRAATVLRDGMSEMSKVDYSHRVDDVTTARKVRQITSASVAINQIQR
jgi:hypothetical protein